MLALVAVSIFAPSLDEAAASLRSFFAEAGPRAPALSPRAVGAEAYRAFGFDALDAEDAARCGADGRAPVAWDTETGVATFGVRARTATRECLEAWLSRRRGEREESIRKGTATVLVSRSKGSRPYAGYALSRERAWVYLGGARDGGAALKEAVKRGKPAAPALAAADRAPLYAVAGDIAVAVIASKYGLLARGRMRARAGPAPVASADGALAWAAGDLLGLLRFEDAFAWAVGRSSGPAPPAAELARELALEGGAAVLLAGLDLRAPLPPPAGLGDYLGPFFLFRHAYLARSADPARARRYVESLGDLRVGGRAVHAGVEGALVWLATDETARDAALAAARSSTPSPAPALAGRADPRAFARALDRLSVLTAARSDTLLGLYAAKLQLLPLLEVAGIAELTGERRGRELHFTLKAPLR